MRRRFDDVKDSKDTWHVLFIDHYVPFLNLRIAKVSEVLERQWRHRRVNQLGVRVWMRKGEGQDLTRRWTSSGECSFAATRRRLWKPRYTEVPVAGTCTLATQYRAEECVFTVGILLSRWQVRTLFVRERSDLIQWSTICRHLRPQRFSRKADSKRPRKTSGTLRNALYRTSTSNETFATLPPYMCTALFISNKKLNILSLNYCP